jgi:hypothetical protein
MSNVTKRPPSLNAAKHFCTSRTLIIGDEDWDEFNALVEEFTREYKPRTRLDKHWVEGAARSLWFSRRSNKEFDSMMQRLTAGGRTPSQWDPQQQAEHDRLLRYRKSDQREFERAYRGVEHLRTRRAQRRREKRAIAVADATIACKKAQIKKLESKTTEPTPPPPPPPPPTEPDLWDQRVLVEIVDGAVKTRTYPTNENFRDFATTEAAPDTQVLRTFRFPHGVPPAFDWMFKPEHRQPGVTHSQRMPLETWLALTEEEEKLGAFLDPRKFRDDSPRAA